MDNKRDAMIYNNYIFVSCNLLIQKTHQGNYYYSSLSVRYSYNFLLCDNNGLRLSTKNYIHSQLSQRISTQTFVARQSFTIQYRIVTSLEK